MPCIHQKSVLKSIGKYIKIINYVNFIYVFINFVNNLAENDFSFSSILRKRVKKWQESDLN